MTTVRGKIFGADVECVIDVDVKWYEDGMDWYLDDYVINDVDEVSVNGTDYTDEMEEHGIEDQWKEVAYLLIDRDVDAFIEEAPDPWEFDDPW